MAGDSGFALLRPFRVSFVPHDLIEKHVITNGCQFSVSTTSLLLNHTTDVHIGQLVQG